MNSQERQNFILGIVVGIGIGLVLWALFGLCLLALGVFEWW